MTSTEETELIKQFGPIKKIVPTKNCIRIISKDDKVYEAPRKKEISVPQLILDPLWGITLAMLPKEMQDWLKTFAAYYKKGDKLANGLIDFSTTLLKKISTKTKPYQIQTNINTRV